MKVIELKSIYRSEICDFGNLYVSVHLPLEILKSSRYWKSDWLILDFQYLRDIGNLIGSFWIFNYCYFNVTNLLISRQIKLHLPLLLEHRFKTPHGLLLIWLRKDRPNHHFRSVPWSWLVHPYHSSRTEEASGLLSLGL